MGLGNIFRGRRDLWRSFEVLVAAWQSMLRRGSFYRHTKEDKPAEASRGRAEACSSRFANSFARDEPLRASFLPLPLLLASSARRKQETVS